MATKLRLRRLLNVSLSFIQMALFSKGVFMACLCRGRFLSKHFFFLSLSLSLALSRFLSLGTLDIFTLSVVDAVGNGHCPERESNVALDLAFEFLLRADPFISISVMLSCTLYY